MGLCLHSRAFTHSTSDIHSLGFARFGAFAGVRSWGVIEAWAHSPNVASSRCSLGGMEPFREGHRSRGYLFPVPLLPLSLGAAGGSVGAIEDFGGGTPIGAISPPIRAAPRGAEGAEGGGPNRGRDSPYRGAPPKSSIFHNGRRFFLWPRKNHMKNENSHPALGSRGCPRVGPMGCLQSIFLFFCADFASVFYTFAGVACGSRPTRSGDPLHVFVSRAACGRRALLYTTSQAPAIP